MRRQREDIGIHELGAFPFAVDRAEKGNDLAKSRRSDHPFQLAAMSGLIRPRDAQRPARRAHTRPGLDQGGQAFYRIKPATKSTALVDCGAAARSAISGTSTPFAITLTGTPSAS